MNDKQATQRTQHLTAIVVATSIVAATGFTLAARSGNAHLPSTERRTSSASVAPHQATAGTAGVMQTNNKVNNKPPRDLSQYRQAPSITIADSATLAQRERYDAAVRAFIKQQWAMKQRGRIATISTLVRGFAPGETAYYIEPDDAGRWRVSIEVQGQDAAQQFYQVEEVEVDADAMPVVAGQRGVRRALNLRQPAGGGAEMIF